MGVGERLDLELGGQQELTRDQTLWVFGKDLDFSLCCI